MFAIPGISALMIFILARPQEFFTLLQRVPFLHLFTALAVLGWVIDIRLRRLQPIASPSLPWVGAFLGWCMLSCAIKTPELLIPRAIEMAILFAIYGTIAHGIQRFRTFQLVAAVLLGTGLFITALCFAEGISPTQCVAGVDDGDDEASGTPDGRECDTRDQCRLGPEVVPGMEYQCEHVGLFGMSSIEGRTRYIGELHDPNEVALVISTSALSFLIGFLLRKRSAGALIVLGVATVIVVWTVLLTQSRGGLVAAMLVPGVYVVRRYGLAAIIPAAGIALPVIAFSGRSGESADMSTQLRYEAWQAGIGMFHDNPIFGVGPRQFAEHHFITAHNSYVLTLGELGLPGFFLFVAILYISIKTLVVGLRELRNVPGTRAAQIWGMALLASMIGATFQINTLSFAYHSALWILFGMAGAWFSCVRTHRPEFAIRMLPRDLLIVAGIVVGYAFVVLPIFLHSKGY